jgi:hypothetical protein
MTCLNVFFLVFLLFTFTGCSGNKIKDIPIHIKLEIGEDDENIQPSSERIKAKNELYPSFFL